MSEEEYAALEQAFERTFIGLVQHGVISYDPWILRALWLDFLIDLANGFPSLTLGKRHGGQS